MTIVLTLVAGILYGSQGWLQLSDEVSTTAPANAAAALRQSSTTRKSERPRTTDNIGLAPVKTRSAADANTDQQTGEKRNVVEAQKSQPEKIPVVVVVAKPQAVSGRGLDSLNSASRKNVRRPGAPSIRFPNPEFSYNAPAP